MDKETTFSGRGAINIALIKYWGKSDEDIIIPLNNSLSITLDTNTFFTSTTISLVDGPDSLQINGKSHELSKRISNILNFFRLRSKLEKGVRIESSNNFPTAAGCASSASSMSILAKLLMKAFNCKEDYEHETSAIARLVFKKAIIRLRLS